MTVIDFPQMVSIHHRNARMLFDRDVECLHKFFLRRYGYDAELDVMGEPDPDFDEILKEVAEKEKNGEFPGYEGIPVMPIRDLFVSVAIITEAFKTKSTKFFTEHCFPVEIT